MLMAWSHTNCIVLPHMLGLPIGDCIEAAAQVIRADATQQLFGLTSNNGFEMRLTLSQTSCTILPHVLGLQIARCIEATVEVSKQLSLATKQELK